MAREHTEIILQIKDIQTPFNAKGNNENTLKQLNFKSVSKKILKLLTSLWKIACSMAINAHPISKISTFELCVPNGANKRYVTGGFL
jgi:hypothetical protein